MKTPEIVWAPSKSGVYHKVALATRAHCDHRIILNTNKATKRDPLMDGCNRCRAIIAHMERERGERA